MGRMAGPHELSGRDIKCSGAGAVPCGNLGCLPQTRCCNADAGCRFPLFTWGYLVHVLTWCVGSCGSNGACFTTLGTVDCYVYVPHAG